jgi:hypothetical protein
MPGQRAVPTAAQPEDAWDRLAALAFGGSASAGGCSAHAHDYDCTCLAEYGVDDYEVDGSAEPGDELPVSADPELEVAD